MQFPLVALSFAASVVVQPLVDGDVLEPSVRNEVYHALSRVPQKTVEDCRCVSGLPFPTNGMSRTDIAIRLVSEQKPDGRWLAGTNDVTAAAVEILKAL